MAPPFDAYADTQTGNYLGYSRGADPFSAIGTAAKGAGQFVGVMTNTVDDLIKMRIDKEAREKVEPVRDAAIHALETGQMSVPDEVKGGLSKAEQMKMAKEAGVLDESHYWNLLDAEARRLRAQHPGYRDYVDSRIAALSGADPANRLVQKLYDEKQALANEKATSWRTERVAIETEYRKAGLAGSADGTGTGRDLSTMSIEEMKRDLGQLYSKQAKIKEDETNIDYMIKRDQAVTQHVKKTAGVEAEDYVNSTIKSGMKQFDSLVDAWNSSADKATKNRGMMNPKDLEQVRTTFAELENTVSSNIDQIFAKRRAGGTTWAYHLDAKQRQEIKDGAMLPLKTLREAIFNSETGTIGAIQNRIKALEGTDVLNIYSVSKLARLLGSARTIVGSNAIGVLGDLTGELTKDAAQGSKFMDGIVDSVTKPNASLNNTLQEFGGQEGVKPIAMNRIIDNHITNLRTADPSSKAFQIGARYFFGPNNKDLFGQIDETTGQVSLNYQDPYTLYQRMAGDPVIATQMGKLKGVDDVTYNNWSKFVNGNFETLMKATTDNIQSYIESMPGVKVVWNDKTLRLEAQPDPTSERRQIPGAVNPRNVGALFDPIISLQGRTAINQMNQVLSGLKAFYTAEGNSPADTSAAIVQKMSNMPGLNLNAPKKGNLLDMIAGAFKESKAQTEAEETAKPGEKKPSTDKGIKEEKFQDRLPEGGQGIKEPKPYRPPLDTREGRDEIRQKFPDVQFDISGQGRPPIIKRGDKWYTLVPDRQGKYILGPELKR